MWNISWGKKRDSAKCIAIPDEYTAIVVIYLMPVEGER